MTPWSRSDATMRTEKFQLSSTRGLFRSVSQFQRFHMKYALRVTSQTFSPQEPPITNTEPHLQAGPLPKDSNTQARRVREIKTFRHPLDKHVDPSLTQTGTGAEVLSTTPELDGQGQGHMLLRGVGDAALLCQDLAVVDITTVVRIHRRVVLTLEGVRRGRLVQRLRRLARLPRVVPVGPSRRPRAALRCSTW